MVASSWVRFVYGCFDLCTGLSKKPLDTSLLERANWNLWFFKWRQSSREGSIKGYHSYLGVARSTSGPIRLQDLLIISISGRNKLTPLSDNVNYFLYFLSNLAGVYLVMNCLTVFILLKTTRSLHFLFQWHANYEVYEVYLHVSLHKNSSVLDWTYTWVYYQQ